jgi:hypothetical protein
MAAIQPEAQTIRPAWDARIYSENLLLLVQLGVMPAPASVT